MSFAIPPQALGGAQTISLQPPGNQQTVAFIELNNLCPFALQIGLPSDTRYLMPGVSATYGYPASNTPLEITALGNANQQGQFSGVWLYNGDPMPMNVTSSGVSTPASTIVIPPSSSPSPATPPPIIIGGVLANFYASQNIAPNTSIFGTVTTPNEMVTDWMILSRGGVGAGGGTIPLTVGYPTNADAAVQDVITITSSITGTQLFQNTINQQLYFSPGYNNNNGGQAGLFAVLPFIPNANIELQTLWNTSLTDDLPMTNTALLLVNKPYAYLSSLPSFGFTAINVAFAAGQAVPMVLGSNMHPYDWITVNVNNPNNTPNLTVEIYLGAPGYGLSTLLLPSTILGVGQNFFNVRMATGGLTSSMAVPQIIVAITSSVAQSVFVWGYAYPDLSKPLLLV